MRFLLGLLTGLAALGGYVGYERWSKSRDPCAERCGTGTRCAAGRCVAADDDEPGPAPRKRAPRRARRRPRGDGVAGEAPLRKPTAAELRPLARGASLRQAEVVDLASADDSELSSDEIDRRFRTLDRPIAACLERAREGYELAGRVAIALRIERAGDVQKWRLTAPALLVQRGLHGCLDPLVRGLRFPRASRATIMTYPYALD